MAMADTYGRLSKPRVYLIRMLVFLILTGFVAAILYPQVKTAFLANPGLNGLILFTLLVGTAYAFRAVWRLFREINWVNNFRIAEPDAEIPYTPVLLAPMEALLQGKQGRMVLSPLSLRSMLDSLAARLDEARDLTRYLIGLLIFLGLLGTFWGLLDTVSSVATTIRSLDVAANESSTIFEDLKAGLEAPLQGMGTAFSSSLFGLSGSLVLGFLELQAGQAQNRFYNDLENWLSSMTDIEAGEAGGAMPGYMRLDLREIQESIDTMNDTLESALEPIDETDEGYAPSQAAQPQQPQSVDALASAVQGLVTQMREEQKVVRDWAQAQADQQGEIKDVLSKLADAPSPQPSTEPKRTNPKQPAKKA
ncbi:MAG: flagellar motor protein MotA [Hyphomicrobiales bacterium]